MKILNIASITAIVLLTLTVVPVHAFATLSDLMRYTASHQEHPESDDASYNNPRYTIFHRKLAPAWHHPISNFFSRSSTKWTIHSFHQLLKKYLKTLEKNQRDEHVILDQKPNSTFVIFGNIHGAIHSLARDLQQLKELAIIDEQFKIIKPDHYLLFNGNAVDLSAYSLEVLSVILTLLLTNPQHVVYIRGAHEDKETWLDYALAEDLRMRAAKLSSEFVPLKTSIKQLFESLAKAFVIRDTAANSCIVVSSLTRDVQAAALFAKGLALQALITSHDTKKNLDLGHPARGLYLLSKPDTVPTQWAVVSSPVTTYRTSYNFHFDAFALLSTGTTLQSSTITCYYHDTRKPQEPFATSPTFSVATGKQLTQTAEQEEHEKITVALCGTKPQEKVLFIGSTMDLSRALAIPGKNLQLGITLCINEENKRGGIRGKIIKPIFMDDQFDAQQARRNIDQFVKEYDSTIVLCPVGSPTLDAYTDLLEKNKIFVFFPITGANKFRSHQLPNIAHWRISYQDECRLVTGYMLEHYKPKLIDFFYQNDLFGESFLEGALQALKGKTQKHRSYPFEPKNLQLNTIVQSITQQPPQVLGFFCASSPSMELIRQVPVSTLKTIHLYGMSIINEISFRSLLAERGFTMTFGQAMPSPHTNTWPLITEYKKLIDDRGIKSDPFILEGYMSASLMIEILRRVDGPLTNENITRSITSFKHYNYKGMELNFDPKTNEIARYLWIETETGEWITVDSKTQ